MYTFIRKPVIILVLVSKPCQLYLVDLGLKDLRFATAALSLDKPKQNEEKIYFSQCNTAILSSFFLEIVLKIADKWYFNQINGKFISSWSDLIKQIKFDKD
jgi:hypothetical protein